MRAAVVKAGIGYWSITTFEHRVLAAVAATWARTGAAVMVHLEHGSAAFEVLAELARDGRSTTPIEAFAIERFLTPSQAAVAEVASTTAAH